MGQRIPELKPGMIIIRAGECPQVTALCVDRQVREFDCCDTGARSRGYAHDDSCAYRMWLSELFSGLIRQGGWMEQQIRTPDGARPIALQVVRCSECGQHAIRIGSTVFGGVLGLCAAGDKWDVAYTYEATISQIREVIL